MSERNPDSGQRTETSCACGRTKLIHEPSFTFYALKCPWCRKEPTLRLVEPPAARG